MIFSEGFQNFLDDILFVVVLYKMRLNDSPSFKSIAEFLNQNKFKVHFFVYDNTPFYAHRVQNDHSELCEITYIHDSTNPGVGKAYNVSYDYAMKSGKRWMLLLDQDTVFREDALEVYFKRVRENPEQKLFAPILTSDTGAIFSPCWYFLKKGFPVKKINLDLASLASHSLLNSGILIDVRTFGDLGGYNEAIKLDFSDFEFIDRYKRKTISFSLVPTRCIHGLSECQDDSVASLNRFGKYCESIRVLVTIDNSSVVLVFFALLRALKLSRKFKNKAFLLEFKNQFFDIKA